MKQQEISIGFESLKDLTIADVLKLEDEVKE